MDHEGQGLDLQDQCQTKQMKSRVLSIDNIITVDFNVSQHKAAIVQSSKLRTSVANH